jgi:hypothetical protein
MILNIFPGILSLIQAKLFKMACSVDLIIKSSTIFLKEGIKI